MQNKICIPVTLRFLCFLLFSCLFFCAGCAGPAPQRGGRASHTSASGARMEFHQPENPKDGASQHTESSAEKAYPPGTVIRETESRLINGQTNTIVREITVPTNAPAPLTMTTRDSSQTSIGGSWRDTARELAERVKSIRPVMYFGLAMLLVAGAFAYFGWWTKAGIAAGAGAGAILLAQVLPGHEGMIIAGGGILVVVGALLVLYVYHKGQLDANRNGIPDRLE
jgi:hypothetical protein